MDDVWLVFEVETRVMNLFTTANRTLRLDLTELDTVQHKRGMFGDTLVLKPQRGSALSGLPGGGSGELRLRIARKHRPDLAGLLERLRLWTV